MSGFVFLIIAMVTVTIYYELQKTQGNISEMQENVPEIQENVPEIEPKTAKYVEKTGTPADNYSPDERDSHCGKADAKSNQYIQEFEITTPCTQPLSIITDAEDNVWFVQSNTGNIATFDPVSKEFTEYENDQWGLKKASMMWGIAYTDDNEVWFTDETNDVLWRFSIDDKTYSKFDFPGESKNEFPQKIEYYDNHFFINDFTGNRVVVVNHDDLDDGKTTYSAITTPSGSFTSQTPIDDEGNVWFVVWKYQKEAILVKTSYKTQESVKFSLPSSINAPNGVSVGPLGNVWIADTAGNSFYKFNPDDSKTIEFVTSSSPAWSYGNSTGLIKTPITRPYWTGFDSKGNLWFNEQSANRLSMFDPKTESLVEYDIPSRNPGWADCNGVSDCGTSQSFGFTTQDEKVWFTEWAENNIGVLDTSVTIPVSLSVEKNEIPIEQGKQKEIIVTVTPETNQSTDVVLTGNTNSELIKIKVRSDPISISEYASEIPVSISVEEGTKTGSYKVLLGTQLAGVSTSTYVTIKVI